MMADNEQNVSNYRFHLGDQKHKIKTKNGKVMDVKKVDYRGSFTALKSHSQHKPLAPLEPSILTVDSKRIKQDKVVGDYRLVTEPSASQVQKSSLGKTTIIFNNQELLPKELDYSSCSQHFKVNQKSQMQNFGTTRTQTLRAPNLPS
jgi:hypothetical protein